MIKQLTGSLERRGDSKESQPAVARVTFSVKHLDVTQNESSTAAEPWICLGHGEGEAVSQHRMMSGSHKTFLVIWGGGYRNEEVKSSSMS